MSSRPWVSYGGTGKKYDYTPGALPGVYDCNNAARVSRMVLGGPHGATVQQLETVPTVRPEWEAIGVTYGPAWCGAAIVDPYGTPSAPVRDAIAGTDVEAGGAGGLIVAIVSGNFDISDPIHTFDLSYNPDNVAELMREALGKIFTEYAAELEPIEGGHTQRRRPYIYSIDGTGRAQPLPLYSNPLGWGIAGHLVFGYEKNVLTEEPIGPFLLYEDHWGKSGDSPDIPYIIYEGLEVRRGTLPAGGILSGLGRYGAYCNCGFVYQGRSEPTTPIFKNVGYYPTPDYYQDCGYYTRTGENVLAFRLQKSLAYGGYYYKNKGYWQAYAVCPIPETIKINVISEPYQDLYTWAWENGTNGTE